MRMHQSEFLWDARWYVWGRADALIVSHLDQPRDRAREGPETGPDGLHRETRPLTAKREKRRLSAAAITRLRVAGR